MTVLADQNALRMDHFEPPAPSAEPFPAADLQAPSDQSQVIVQQAYPVLRPEADANDFIIQVRATTLHRCRDRLSRLSSTAFPWHDIFLAVSMLSFGGLLGAIPAKLQFGWFWGVFFYSILPAMGAGSAVAFFLTRKRLSEEPILIADEVLQELPDPDVAR